jgi:hypothetical protein
MSDFSKFKQKFVKHFERNFTNDELFITDVDKDLLWDTYLESFPEGANKIYRERREYDCNCCKQFIRPYANMVTIKDNQLLSIWDIPELEYPFDVVAEKMSDLVKSEPIKNRLVVPFKNLGTNKNHEELPNGKIKTWEHFSLTLRDSQVYKGSDSVGSAEGGFRTTKEVFERAMRELTLDSAEIVLDLIDQNSLYRGEEFREQVKLFANVRKSFDKVPLEEQDNWLWLSSSRVPVARIRNTAIGTLLVDLSANVELDEAVRKFEAVVAPTNYKRPKPVFTKKMIEAAEAKIEELGLTDSLGRRFAKLEDITVNNVLFVNRDAEKKMGGSIFDELKEEVPTDLKSLDKVAAVSVDDFVNNILPHTTNLEVMVEGRHEANLTSLIAPENMDAPSLFKWDNPFSWTYKGNLADSSMKQNVKKAGGNVEGVLRFSIQWNDNPDQKNLNDFDAHCVEPTGNVIYYGNKRNSKTNGNLDVDIINPNGVAVENITWPSIDKMQEGRYKFMVHNFTDRGGVDGFSAEIEFDGEVYQFSHRKIVRSSEKVLVAEIEFSRANGIKFIKSLDSTVSSKDVWGIKTNQFARVSTFMFSPNHWDGNSTGNRHYFFFLEGCKNDENPRGFMNEQLKEDFTPHRKVFEALGAKLRVPDSDEQLSGLGFSTTKQNNVIVRVEGKFKRVIKILF